jgi:sRNA-binding protein
MGPRLALVLAALATGLAACGPVAYVGDVTLRADDAVAAARRAEAEKLAPYWWTRATQYLHKARERAAYADFQGANRFGRLAAEAAEQAIVDAKDPSKRPIDPEEPGAEEPGAEEAPASTAPAPAKAAPAPAKAAPVPATEAPVPAKAAP